MAKILLIEDDLMLSKLVCQNLKAKFHVVDRVADADEALGYIEASQFDLVIMDWNLPGTRGLTGIELCTKYRERGGNAPVLFMTGNSEIEHKSAGFNAGADDYICKPFDMKELLMRVESLLRRPANVTPDVLQCGDLLVEPRSGRVKLSDKEVKLQPREMALLEFLMRHPDTLFEPEALLDRVWETDSEPTEVALRICISNIRKKLSIIEQSNLIESVHGRGYRFNSN